MKLLEKLNVSVLIYAFTGEDASGVQMESYLDVETGELLQLFDFDAAVVGESAAKEVRALRARVEKEPARYALVPALKKTEEHELRERFAQSLPDAEDRSALVQALGGGRQAFKDAASRVEQLDAWQEFHTAGAERLVRAWLTGLGLEAPARVIPPAPPTPTLVDLLIFGGAKWELTDGKVRRVLVAPTSETARSWFRALAHAICDQVGAEWKKQFVENTDRIERGRFTLQVSGAQLVLFVAVDPKVRALF
jgi:hypothetical protein